MKLLSPLAIFFASLISTILAGDCNNPLLTIFNIQSLGTPTEVSGLKYCKSLQSSQSCCSADTINGFQTKANELAERLKAIVAARDRQIVETRDNVIPQLRASLQALKDNSQQALNVLNYNMYPSPTNGDPWTNTTDPWSNNTDPWPNNTDPWPNNTYPVIDLWPNNTDPWPNNTDPWANDTDPWSNNTDPWANNTDPWPNNTNPWPNNTDPWPNTNPWPNNTYPWIDPVPTNTDPNPSFSVVFILVESLGKLSQQVVDDLPGIKGSFTAFQKSRSTCVIQMVKLQAAAWCLSCDPNYASKGVSGSNNVLLSNNVCDRLESSCYEFISQSSQQSSILSIKSLAPKIGAMSTGLQMIIANNLSGLTEFISALAGTSNSNNDVPPVTVPNGCTAGQCQWICTDLFKNGQVNETLISAGGKISSITDSSEGDGSRILLEEGTAVKSKLMKRRALLTSEWNPDQDEAGVEVTFVDDPAGVNRENSNTGGLIQSSLIGLFALIATLMLN